MPTLGPINPSKDSWFYSTTALTGYGQHVALGLTDNDPSIQRIVTQVDISAIPSGSTITSATFTMKVSAYFTGTPAGRTIEAVRLKQYNWEDASGAGAECNWTNYIAAGPTAWPVGAGAADVDETYKVTTTIAAIGSRSSFNILDLAQDALDNYSGLVNLRVRYSDEDEAPNPNAMGFHSLNAAGGADRPEFTIEYTLPAGYKTWQMDILDD